MARAPRGLDFGNPQAAPFAQGLGGLTSVFLKGMKIQQGLEANRLEKEKIDAVTEAAENKLKLAKEKAAVDKSTALLAAVKGITGLTRGVAKLVAPNVLATFFDTESVEGKRFISTIVGADPEDAAELIKKMTQSVQFPGAPAILADPGFQERFFKNPVAGIIELQKIGKQARAAAKERRAEDTRKSIEGLLKGSAGAGSQGAPGERPGLRQSRVAMEASGKAMDVGNLTAALKLSDLGRKLRDSDKPEDPKTEAGKMQFDLNQLASSGTLTGPAVDALNKGLQDLTRGKEVTLSEQATVRTQFIKGSQTFLGSMRAFTELNAFATDPTGVGDIGILFSMVRIFQGGAGRISDEDIRITASAGSFWQDVQGWILKLRTGKRLPPLLRAEFISKGRQLFLARMPEQLQLIKEFEGIADRARINRKDVVIDFMSPKLVSMMKGFSSDRPALRQEDVVGITPKIIAGMSDDELKFMTSFPSGTLSKEQLDAVLKRAKEGRRVN